ncbi:hypothetical protein OXX69_013832, partial [Metschnikowia pulcherrima]
IVLDFSIEGELSLGGMNLHVLEGEDVPAFTHEKILDPTVVRVLRNNTLIDSEDVSTEEEAEPEAKKATFEVKLRYAKKATEISAGPKKTEQVENCYRTKTTYGDPKREALGMPAVSSEKDEMCQGKRS